eukprot:jgi/Ulvmu1/3187/UM015_0228.1
MRVPSSSAASSAAAVAMGELGLQALSVCKAGHVQNVAEACEQRFLHLVQRLLQEPPLRADPSQCNTEQEPSNTQSTEASARERSRAHGRRTIVQCNVIQRCLTLIPRLKKTRGLFRLLRHGRGLRAMNVTRGRARQGVYVSKKRSALTLLNTYLPTSARLMGEGADTAQRSWHRPCAQGARRLAQAAMSHVAGVVCNCK